MKKFKGAKASEGEDGVDKISNLPDDVLLLILSRITSTEEVIRTSILSTRWRYLWASIPFIDIDYTRSLDTLDRLESTGFKEFVYWVLLHKPLDLDSFRLWCCNYYNMSTIRRWIHAAVMRKVKLLDLMFCPTQESEDIEIPHCLMTCGSLEVLKLCLLGWSLNLPKFTGFPALRVLELTDVSLFEDDLVDYFLKSCPLLEDLTLIDCDAYSLEISCPKLKSLRIESQLRVTDEEYLANEDLDWKMCMTLDISCPKLEFLKLKDYVALEFNFDNLYSLKKAVIHPRDLFAYDEPRFDLFHDMYHVQSLSISLYFVVQCGYMPEIDDRVSLLPKLKTLELKVDELHMLIPFLKCLPDLEYLHLIFPKNIYGLEKWNQKKLTSPAKLSILTRHLKKVEFLEFDEEELRLVVARALLMHANELEEMVFIWDNEAKFHERSIEAMNQVSKFQKASPNVKLKGVLNPKQADTILIPKVLETDSIKVDSSF